MLLCRHSRLSSLSMRKLTVTLCSDNNKSTVADQDELMHSKAAAATVEASLYQSLLMSTKKSLGKTKS